MSNVTFVAEWMNTVNTKYIQKVPRSVEQRTVIKFLVGENVPSAEIHHRLQQQYGEECLRSYLNHLVTAWQQMRDVCGTFQGSVIISSYATQTCVLTDPHIVMASL